MPGSSREIVGKTRFGLSREGFAHRSGLRRRSFPSIALDFPDFFTHQRAKLAVGFLLGRAVADATPREQVRAVTHVKFIFIIPPDEAQVLIFSFHSLAWRMALRTCFS